MFLRKELGIDRQHLTNREKTQLVDALRPTYTLAEQLGDVGLPRSSYFYHRARLEVADKYVEVRSAMTNIFERNYRCYGYRRMQAALTRQSVNISERVVRRLMKQESLVAVASKRRRYGSYMGEISPAPDNLLNRDFSASAPNEKWLTDITEFQIPAGKVFRVTRRIEQGIKRAALEPGTPECLGPAEVFLLIAAAYAHDLGMTVFPGEEDALLSSLGLDRTTEWKTNTGLQDHLRAEHSRRGGKYILQNADSLGVPLNLVGALDLMMQAHNLSIAKLDAVKTSFAAQERLIDVRQLGAIVCIADALEFSDTRVVDGVLAKINADPSERARVSYRENMKHVCIGDSLAIDNGRVIVSGVFPEAPVIALAHHTLDQMEGWVTRP